MTSIVNDLKKRLIEITESKESNRDSTSDLIHWSSLLYQTCERYYSLAKFFPQDVLISNSASTRITFDIGRHVEEIERRKLITIYGRENVLGIWNCLCSSKRGFGPPEEKCSQCGAPYEYDEFKLPLTKFNISGSPDIIIRVNDTLYVFEIKSKSGKLFDEIKSEGGADLKHILQAGSYVHFLNHYLKTKNIKLNISNTFIIYYVRKDNNKYKDPYYLFEGDANDTRVSEEIKTKISLAKTIQHNIEKKRIPKRCCETEKDGRKIECPAVSKCFKLP